jgi:type IV pilus assembly protein PilN
MRGVNLFPPEVTEKKQLLQQKQKITLLTATIIGGLLLIYLGLFVSVQRVQRRVEEKKILLAAEEKKLENIRALLNRIARIEEDTAVLNTKVRMIEELIDEKFHYWEILRELSRIVPKQVWFREFILHSQTRELVLKGSAFSEVSIARFLEGLESSPYFREIILQETKKNETGDYKDFELTCLTLGKEEE